MENGKPHYCEACHQIALAENIKLQEEIKDLCKNNEEIVKHNKFLESRIEDLKNTINEIKSNKNGVYHTIKYFEDEIKSSTFGKEDLARIYIELVKLYNCLDEEDFKRKRPCRFI